MPRIPEGLAVSISIWTGVGTALGIAIGNLGLWIPAGVAIGVTLWVVRNEAK
jgi:zinc transporter ZupT